MRFKRQPLTEIAAQNRRRDADLARLATGWTPSADDLQDAPTLSYWIEYTPPGQTAPMLMGHLKGHPRVLDGWTQTEQVLARGDGWVRMHDGWLRLGPPMPPRPAPTAPVSAREATDDDLSWLPDYGLAPASLDETPASWTKRPLAGPKWTGRPRGGRR